MTLECRSWFDKPVLSLTKGSPRTPLRRRLEGSPVEGCHVSEPGLDCVGEHIPGETPGPVATGGSRTVHPGFAAQSQDVLKRDDCGIGNGHQGQTDEVPVDLSAIAPHVFQGKTALALPDLFALSVITDNFLFEPADGGVVVVGAGVDHAVSRVVVRPVVVGFRVVAEGELENSHTGECELLPQCIYLRRDQAQVLGNDGHVAQRFEDGFE